MNVQIVGTMLDPSGGEPAGGAMIQFIALAQYGGVPKGAQSTQTTSATGEYDFPLNYGRYSLSINHSGRFVNQAVSVTVNEDSPPIMDIDLLLQSSVPLTPPEFKYLEELLAKAEQAADDAEGFASDAAYQVSLAEGEVIKATNQANIASNEADRAKSEADRATEVTGLDTVEQAVDHALAEFAGIMTESEARAINATNDNHFGASGFVSMGKHNSASSAWTVNEGLWGETISSVHSNRFYTGRADTSLEGSSKTDFPVTHIAGAVTNILNISESGNRNSAFELPEAEDGTRIYDSTGDARGSGKASLDLKVDVDPKYGDVPTGTEDEILREAVGRAFEGQAKNGDLRFGLSNFWYTQDGGAVTDNGDGTFLLTNSAANAGDYTQEVSVEANTDYEVSFYVKDVASTPARFFVGSSGSNNNLVNYDGGSVEGTRVTTTFNSGAYTLVYLRYSPSSGLLNDAMIFGSTEIRKTTEEVVTHPVDGVFLEHWEEEQTDPNRIEVAECIQSLSTTFGDTDVPTVLSTRKLSYFQQYEGQFPEVTADPDFINDRYRCVVWGDLSKEQKRKVAAYMGEKLFVGVNGNIVNGRLRARTIRGVGNGDWRNVNANQDNEYLQFDVNNRIKPQGALDAPLPISGSFPTYPATRYGSQNGLPYSGVFSATNGSNGQPYTNAAYQGRCFMYVVATIPRANKGAYHPDLNPYGSSTWVGENTSGHKLWHALGNVPQPTKQDCFRAWVAGEPVPCLDGRDGAIGTLSGHPDGIFYDGIEAGGLNGVIDCRLGAVANDSPEEAAKVEAKVESGTYRGLEKLVFSMPMVGAQTELALASTVHGSAVRIGYSGVLPEGVNADLGGDNLINKGYVIGDSGAAYTIVRVWKSSSNVFIQLSPLYGDVRSDFASGNDRYSVVTSETNLSVSGEFNTQMVIGDPANILLTDALKYGWLGTWCPVIPDGAPKTFEFSRKDLEARYSRTYTNDNGVTWAVAGRAGSWSGVSNAMVNELMAIDRVEIHSYKAFARQTKTSTNKPVYNAKAGLLGVTVTQSYDKSVLAEAVAGIILKSDASGIITEQSSPVKFLINEAIERITSLTTDMIAPTNSSQAIKIAIYQISENGQVSLGFIANTMTHNGVDWGELDEIIIPFGDLEVDTFNDANGILQTAQSTMSAIPHGWTSNHARAGVQVPGVDL